MPDSNNHRNNSHKRQAIDLQGVSLDYDGIVVLEQITFSIQKPGIVAILGPNGCGKSTLIKSLVGLCVPSVGSLVIAGQIPSRTSRPTLAKKVSYLPQQVSFAFSFTSRQIVEMATYQGNATQDKVDIALSQCGIGHLANRPFGTLSGGQQRKILLAQTICQNTTITLLDEPTAALDPKQAIEVMELIQRQAATNKTTYLVSTHDINLALRYADRILVLAQHTLHSDGSATKIIQSGCLEKAYGVGFEFATGPSGNKYLHPYGVL